MLQDGLGASFYRIAAQEEAVKGQSFMHTDMLAKLKSPNEGTDMPAIFFTAEEWVRIVLEHSGVVCSEGDYKSHKGVQFSLAPYSKILAPLYASLLEALTKDGEKK